MKSPRRSTDSFGTGARNAVATMQQIRAQCAERFRFRGVAMGWAADRGSGHRRGVVGTLRLTDIGQVALDLRVLVEHTLDTAEGLVARDLVPRVDRCQEPALPVVI